MKITINGVTVAVVPLGRDIMKDIYNIGVYMTRKYNDYNYSELFLVCQDLQDALVKYSADSSGIEDSFDFVLPNGKEVAMQVLLIKGIGVYIQETKRG